MKNKLASMVLATVLLFGGSPFTINVVAQDVGIGYIAFSSYRGESRDIYMIDTNGQNLQNLTNTPDIGEFHPSWSPDGRFLAYHAYHDRNADIYVLDMETQTRKRLTDHLGEDRMPTWSPDGKWIAFISNRRASYEIYKISAKGGDSQLLARLRDRDSFGPAWSPDSQWVAFFSVRDQVRNHNPSIYVVSSSGKQMRQLAPALRSGPTWSPTGDEIAFPTSTRARTTHIYVMSAIGQGVRQLTRGTNWDGGPAWSPNGQWIAYASGPPIKGNSKRDIYLIDAAGGEPRQLTTHPSGGRDPAWVPEAFYAVSPSAEKMATLWGEVKKNVGFREK